MTLKVEPVRNNIGDICRVKFHNLSYNHAMALAERMSTHKFEIYHEDFGTFLVYNEKTIGRYNEDTGILIMRACYIDSQAYYDIQNSCYLRFIR